MLCLGKSVVLELIDQDNLKLTSHVNQPTRPLTLQNEPPMDDSHRRIPGHCYPGFSPYWNL
jgi:hypothetical protein